LNHHFY